MLRVVIDTSSLVSYVLTRGELMSKIIAGWRNERFTLLTSPATRNELAEVLARPHIRRLSSVPLDDFVRGLEKYSWLVPGRLELSGICRDPKDDKFLACAVEGKAHYLVSSDRDLLELRYHQDIAILNPGRFLLAQELYAMNEVMMARRFERSVLINIRDTIPLTPETTAQLNRAIENSD